MPLQCKKKNGRLHVVILPVELFINQLDRDPLPFAASSSSFFFCFILLSLRGIFALQNTHTHTHTHTHRDISHIFLKSIGAISSSLCTVMSGQVYYSFYTDIFKFISREMLLTLQANVFLLL